MIKGITKFAALSLIFLSVVFGWSSCSDSNDNSSATTSYKLILGDYSSNYANNQKLVNTVDSLIKLYNTESGSIVSTKDSAYKVWAKVCDSLLYHNWYSEDYLIDDNTWITLTLVSGSTSEVVYTRRVTFPQFVYRFQTSEESANYGLNILAQEEVQKIFTAFYNEGDSTFFCTRTEAKERLEKVCDSILKFNWKNNNLAIQPNSYFTVQLAGARVGQVEPWPTWGKRKVTLPHY